MVRCNATIKSSAKCIQLSFASGTHTKEAVDKGGERERAGTWQQFYFLLHGMGIFVRSCRLMEAKLGRKMTNIHKKVF